MVSKSGIGISYERSGWQDSKNISRQFVASDVSAQIPGSSKLLRGGRGVFGGEASLAIPRQVVPQKHPLVPQKRPTGAWLAFTLLTASASVQALRGRPDSAELWS